MDDIRRRLSFGEVAELYDRTRPSYPSALVDDVLRFAHAGEGDAALEVGAGTGKATVLFAARGLRITALEPSPAMAALARRNCRRYRGVTVVTRELERWRPARPHTFQLLFAAQSWHWVSPDSKYARASEALRPGGALAVFWNRPRWETCALREELANAYQRTVPEFVAPPGPMHPTLGSRPEEWARWRAELCSAAGFGDFQMRRYPWTARHRTEDYVALLRTHSDHVVLEDERRELLLAAVAEVIDRHGGVLALEYETRLGMVRALPRA